MLPDQLTGSVFIGAPIPGQMYRLFVAAAGDNVNIHLAGQVTPNPNTGQLTTVFSQNPQLPFSDLNLRLFSGPLAALANPETCGTFTTTSDITSWSGADATPSSSFNITGCTGDPFAPVVHGRHDQPDRRRALAVHADVLAPGFRPGDLEPHGDAAARTVRQVGSVPLCPERQRERRHLQPVVAGRHRDGRVRAPGRTRCSCRARCT